MVRLYVLVAQWCSRRGLGVACSAMMAIACTEPARYDTPDGPSPDRQMGPSIHDMNSPADELRPSDMAAVDSGVAADGVSAVDSAGTVDASSSADGLPPTKDAPGDAAVDAPPLQVMDAGMADLATAACPNPSMVYNLPCGCAADGKIRCDGTCSTADTACVPTGEFYVLTNLYLTDARRLDTYGVAPNEVFMATGFGYSGQYWKITPLDKGDYRLTNMFLGPDRSLESPADGKKLFMGQTSDVPAQRWRIRAIGNEAGKHFRITNALVGDGRSLDTSTAAPNLPFLNENGNYSGEYWKLTKAP